MFLSLMATTDGGTPGKSCNPSPLHVCMIWCASVMPMVETYAAVLNDYNLVSNHEASEIIE